MDKLFSFSSSYKLVILFSHKKTNSRSRKYPLSAHAFQFLIQKPGEARAGSLGGQIPPRSLSLTVGEASRPVTSLGDD